MTRHILKVRSCGPEILDVIEFSLMFALDGRFANGDTPHVVHMTIKPQEVVDDEDARIAKSGGRDRDSSERTPGCRCVIL